MGATFTKGGGVDVKKLESVPVKDPCELPGLVPPNGCWLTSRQSPLSLNEFAERVCVERLDRLTNDLDKYDWLMRLADQDKRLFFQLMVKHIDRIMPFIYTPTVGAACQELSLVYQNGRGLFITINDKGNVKNIMNNWPEKSIRAICVTDGERILGLGDQGAFGMGIPVGKLALYTGLAGIPPQYLLPVTLDVGTNSEKLLNDPLYFGLKQKRITGDEYDEFIEEFMQACVSLYGDHVLIQFEDFANHNAFRLLKKYESTYATFNDDIQGTASVILAGVLSSSKLTGRSLKEERIVCYGAGEAALGFASLLSQALTSRYGLTSEQARDNLFLVDSKGLVVEGRSSGGLTNHKLEFARPAGTLELTDLEEIIRSARCTTLIGCAAVPGVFSPSILRLMAELNDKPLIMALSNPTSKAECTAEEAYIHTGGKCVFASGSPFGRVSIQPNSELGIESSIEREPGQANNAYIFPGVALGIVTGSIKPVTQDDFLVASETLASLISDNDYSLGRLFPPLSDIRRVSTQIARQVILEANAQGRYHATEGQELTEKLTDEQVSYYNYYPEGS